FAVLPWFHLADSAQATTVYLLRAYWVALLPMLCQIVALGGVGLMGGWFLAFGPAAGALAPILGLIAPDAPTGAATMWVMATVGLLLSLALLQPLYWYVARRAGTGSTA